MANKIRSTPFSDMLDSKTDCDTAEAYDVHTMMLRVLKQRVLLDVSISISICFHFTRRGYLNFKLHGFS
ncbi:Protein CBG26154 [Caenorhabditis briggsae]|uniref:Protein CBG26154 n=1 Tax=Caenorhabditis briggsae TaxID=6238 RepID=B6IIS8_CAEBR|nr:Protein CBG26154 [Caenorhabditis briggsae]CAR99808.1 Protein CBG26154 [Caenorhabditis briggsae]